MDWTEAHLQGDLEAMQQAREEAIVRAALERAAANVQDRAWPDGWNWTASVIADDIRFLANNPAEVAAIIKKAGELYD